MEQRDGLNQRLGEHLAELVNALLEGGMPLEQALTQATRGLADDFEERSEDVADRLASVTKEHLDELRDHEAGFLQRLSSTYGEAFEAFDTVVEVISEAAHDFWHRYKKDKPRDEMIDVLWGNLAQCLRVTREVGHLLRGGFPYGALAAQRTAYEIAVRTSVLSTHGREPEHEDLIERYLLHDHIGRDGDVREYMKNAGTLGFDPMGASEVEAAAATRAELINRFGKKFSAQYGWAVGLPGVTAGHFREVEELAGTSHRRGFYRWSSHYVHGDPSALRMAVMRRGGVSQGVLSNRTNRYLTDPAQFALYALQVTYINLVNNSDGIALADLFIALGLPHLVDRAGSAFWAAEQQVIAAEEIFQHELAAEERDEQEQPT